LGRRSRVSERFRTEKARKEEETDVLIEALVHVLEVGGRKCRQSIHLDPREFFGDEAVIWKRRAKAKVSRGSDAKLKAERFAHPSS